VLDAHPDLARTRIVAAPDARQTSTCRASRVDAASERFEAD
jgi:hypothetical protein